MEYLADGSIRIGNVYHPNIPAWDKYGTRTRLDRKRGEGYQGTGTDGPNCWGAEETVEFDAGHRAILDAMRAEFREQAQRLGDALLTILQSNASIHDALRRPIAERQNTALTARRLEEALREVLAPSAPPHPVIITLCPPPRPAPIPPARRPIKRTAPLFAWFASLGITCSAAIPDDLAQPDLYHSGELAYIGESGDGKYTRAAMFRPLKKTASAQASAREARPA